MGTPFPQYFDLLYTHIHRLYCNQKLTETTLKQQHALITKINIIVFYSKELEKQWYCIVVVCACSIEPSTFLGLIDFS